VSVPVLRQPQDGLQFKQLFGFALLLFASYGVLYEIFSTRPTWGHVETAAMWV
jgi:hypothetical protein